MYIPEFWCGVLVCVGVEFATIIALGVCTARGKDKENDKT